MATDYYTDYEGLGSAPNLPTSPDVPLQPSRISHSRRSSRRGISSRGGSSSPPPLPSLSPPRMPRDGSPPSTDVANDESIPLTDPRRFTPTLHASLVSEILNLRREIDSKDKVIEDLETSLHNTREEVEDTTQKLLDTEKERRAIKRQF